MKQKLVNYLKLGILFFGISLLVVGCQSDDQIIVKDENSHLQKGRIENFSKLSSFVEKLNKKPKDEVDGKTTSLETTNGFDIIYDQDLYIQEENGVETFSIPIHKHNQKAKTFSNLIISFSDTEPTEAFILTYHPSDEYLMTVTTNEQTPFQGSISSESVIYDGSLDNLKSNGLDCRTVKLKYCNWGEQPGDFHVGGDNCTVGYYWFEYVTICFDDEPSLVDIPTSSGGSDSSPSGNDPDYSTAGSSNTNTTNDEPAVVPNIPRTYTNLDIDGMSLEMTEWLNQFENADFKQEMIDLLNEEDPLDRKELEAYLLIRCETSTTPWQDYSGNFKGVPSLPYSQIRHEFDATKGYTYTEFKLDDGNTIVEGDFAETIINGVYVTTDPLPLIFLNNKAEKRLYEIPQPYNNYPSIDLEYLWTNFWGGVQVGLRYFTPLEDVKILIDGTDFDGAEQSRAVSGISLLIDNTPFGKVFKVIRRAGETITTTVPIVRRYVNNIYKTQRRLVKQYKPIIATASNTRKGNWGEMATDVDLIGKGYQDLHVNRITDIDTPSASLESLGIDHVFKNPETGQYIIVESKYGSAQIKNLANGVRQMSDEWILGNNRLLDAVGQNQSLYNDILTNGYERVVSRISPDGTIVYKKLDANGYQILGDNGIFTP